MAAHITRTLLRLPTFPLSMDEIEDYALEAGFRSSRVFMRNVLEGLILDRTVEYRGMDIFRVRRNR